MGALSTSTSNGSYVAAENFVGCRGGRVVPGQRRGVLIHGGRGQTALGNMPPDSITRFLVDAGVPVAYFDCGDGKTWGNPTGVTRVGQAWTFLKSQFGAASDKVVLYGASMGFLPLANWARANPGNVAALIGVVPAISLTDLHDQNRGGYGTEIETAHGVAAPFAGHATITGRDPAQNGGQFPFPVRIYYSTDDPICVPAAATAFAAASGATARSMGAVGHNPGAAPAATAQELALFAAAAA